MKHIIVFGHQQHGKDTVCEYLNDRYGINYSSSSWFACKRFLYEQMRERFGYTSIQACYEDRVNHRQYWYEAICAYNDPDRARLGREIFAEYDIYCGIRDLEEFEALQAAGLCRLAIYVDAAKRKALEPSTSMKLNEEHADIIITNNGSLDELYRKLDRLVQMQF